MQDYNHLSDEEVLSKLRESSDNLDILHYKHNHYCMNFMKSINKSELNKDIFQDAIIVLYEKNRKPDFKLSCSIQTYLNSICRNQILTRFKKSARSSEYSEDYDDRIDDWFDTDESEKSEKIQAAVTGLEKLKELGGKCYEIIKRFFYDKHSMEKIAYDLDYTNADNAKNQKARCQKHLKEIIFEFMKKNK
jgi:RNA polymerase sigma factor (sigma-70 family)